jgi:hypothetical protein
MGEEEGAAGHGPIVGGSTPDLPVDRRLRSLGVRPKPPTRGAPWCSATPHIADEPTKRQKTPCSKG